LSSVDIQLKMYNRNLGQESTIVSQGMDEPIVRVYRQDALH
jgi:hypothetical protein